MNVGRSLQSWKYGTIFLLSKLCYLYKYIHILTPQKVFQNTKQLLHLKVLHKNFWAQKLTMNDKFPVVLDSCMRQFGIFRSTCQGLSMVCWSRVEVKNGLGHISAVENLEKWKKKLSNSSTKVTMVSACFSFFLVPLWKCIFIYQCCYLQCVAVIKATDIYSKWNADILTLSCNCLFWGRKAFRINADFGFMFDWVSKCTKCEKKSPKEVNIVSKSIKSRLTWLSALLRNFVFLHQVMVAGGLDP